MLSDEPLSLPQVDGTEWTPQNYDLTFEGMIPMRRALYQSRNLAAIRLGMELGENNVIQMARRFGLTTPIPAYPSIHIGAADVYPIEMVAAFSTFASLGIRSVPYAIARVESARGEVLWEPTPQRYQVLSREEAWLMVDMMKDVVRRGSAAGVWASGFRVPAGGKTGTTNDYTDVWFIGYTPELVAGVWMGFDRPTKIMGNAQGGRLAAPAWTSFMTEVYQRRSTPSDWPRPEGIIVREIDKTNGLLKNPFCPVDVVAAEYFIQGTEPLRECDVHSPFTVNPDSLTPTVPGAIVPGAAPAPQPGRGRDTSRVENPFKLPP